jgi:hypothetical protein
LLLDLASAVIFGSESRRSRGHILLSQIRDFPFRRLLRLAGSRWRYSIPPPHELFWFESWVLCYDRRSVGQSVLEYSTPLGLTTKSLLLSDTCEFVDLGRPLWREDGSVIYNCYWASPAQSFSGPSPLRLATINFCLSFETSLYVASYDSQGHGGGIRPRLHTGGTLTDFWLSVWVLCYDRRSAGQSVLE